MDHKKQKTENGSNGAAAEEEGEEEEDAEEEEDIDGEEEEDVDGEGEEDLDEEEGGEGEKTLYTILRLLHQKSYITTICCACFKHILYHIQRLFDQLSTNRQFLVSWRRLLVHTHK